MTRALAAVIKNTRSVMVPIDAPKEHDTDLKREGLRVNNGNNRIIADSPGFSRVSKLYEQTPLHFRHSP